MQTDAEVICRPLNDKGFEEVWAGEPPQQVPSETLYDHNGAVCGAVLSSGERIEAAPSRVGEPARCWDEDRHEWRVGTVHWDGAAPDRYDKASRTRGRLLEPYASLPRWFDQLAVEEERNKEWKASRSKSGRKPQKPVEPPVGEVMQELRAMAA